MLSIFALFFIHIRFLIYDLYSFKFNIFGFKIFLSYVAKLFKQLYVYASLSSKIDSSASRGWNRGHRKNC